MLRALLALGAGVGCGLLGMRRGAALRERERELAAWGEALDRLALLLGESVLPLPEALAQAAGDAGRAAQCLRAVAQAMAENPRLSPVQAFDAAAAPYLAWTQPGERERLRRMMGALSRGALPLRRLGVEQAAAFVGQALAQAQAKRRRDAQLYAALGWAAGACLALALL